MDVNNDRIAFLDWLRVVACLMVMCVHVTECFYLGGEAPNVTFVADRWTATWVTVSEGLFRICVPLFVMASSYLLFPVKVSTGAFLKRRLLRVGAPFAVWALAYTLWNGGRVSQLFFNFPDEGGHLWFVPMLAGLYILMPLLSPWAERAEEKEIRWWIVVWLFTTTFPFQRILWRSLFGEPPFGTMPYLWGECPWNAFGAFHYVSGFVGYMLLGLWFRKFAKEMSWGRTLATAVPVWLAGVAIMAIPFYSFFHGKFPYSAPYASAVELERSIEYCSTGVALATIAAFMVFRKFDFRGWFYERVVCPISKASFGMYLLHMFVLPSAFALVGVRLPVPLAIVATALVTFVVSATASVAIRVIPVVGRWICG